MKSILVLTVTVAVVTAVTDHVLWQQFKTTNKKSYGTSEEIQRFRIFQDNLRRIEKHNSRYDKGEETYYLGVTKFADWTPEEFQNMLGISKSLKPKMPEDVKVFKPTGVSLPESIDWREKGAVRSVKEQACGDCWAFSATGALEGQKSIVFNENVTLSEQNLLDCSWDFGNQGCNGGVMTWAFLYVMEYGIETEEDYPYIGKDGQDCKYDELKNAVMLDSYRTLDPDDEVALQEAVATIGPISISIDATDMSLYAGGIFQSAKCSKLKLNHGVLAVGYGSENGQDYWIVKNSWGTNWGEEGYIRMLRNVNLCGVATDASYPIIL